MNDRAAGRACQWPGAPRSRPIPARLAPDDVKARARQGPSFVPVLPTHVHASCGDLNLSTGGGDQRAKQKKAPENRGLKFVSSRRRSRRSPP
jgi:hypothetical protein